jgi:hypothetical protein
MLKNQRTIIFFHDKYWLGNNDLSHIIVVTVVGRFRMRFSEVLHHVKFRNQLKMIMAVILINKGHIPILHQ